MILSNQISEQKLQSRINYSSGAAAPAPIAKGRPRQANQRPRPSMVQTPPTANLTRLRPPLIL